MSKEFDGIIRFPNTSNVAASMNTPRGVMIIVTKSETMTSQLIDGCWIVDGEWTLENPFSELFEG